MLVGSLRRWNGRWRCWRLVCGLGPTWLPHERTGGLCTTGGWQDRQQLLLQSVRAGQHTCSNLRVEPHSIWVVVLVLVLLACT